jgi:hypothetical protein
MASSDAAAWKASDPEKPLIHKLACANPFHFREEKLPSRSVALQQVILFLNQQRNQ